MPATSLDLQELFDDPILELAELDPGFADHGSSVFEVRTAREHVIARSFRSAGAGGSFWSTLRALFGIDPRVASEAVPIYELLSEISPIPVPGLRRVGTASGRAWLVVELMTGAPLTSFAELSGDGLRELGRGLATIHRRRFDTLGSPSGSLRYPPEDFPRRLAKLVRTAAGAGLIDAALAGEMCAAAGELPPPAAGALVLPDIFPPQFLARDGRVTAIVDVDAYVVGPRELDLVGLELFLDEVTAAHVARGYREIAELPALESVRRVYRYFLWVLDMNPTVLDVDGFVDRPAPFR
jgi:hypothetical protein